MLQLFTGFTDRLRAPRRDIAASGDVPTRGPSSIGGTASRKQLLAVVLRETLLRNGVPSDALGMQFFRTIDRAGARTDGIHVRLVVRDGNPELPSCMLALERDFRRRVALIDYRAGEWLQGVTWQFELPEDAPAADLSPVRRGDAQAHGAARPPAPSPSHTYAFTEPAPL